MKRTRTAVAVLAVVLMAAAPSVAGPITGSYDSEFTGDILEGRWSESYAGGGPGQIGNTVHGASWDGSTLATQWELMDMAIDSAPSLLLDTVDGSGNGTRVYFTTYSGGTLTLTDLGPWWNAGDPGTEYEVTVMDYSHTTQLTFVGGVVTAMTTVVEMGGVFADYPAYEADFVIALANRVGEGSPLPADYPSWLPPSATSGHWGGAEKIRMDIVPEPATMALLGLGLLGLMVRKRGRR